MIESRHMPRFSDELLLTFVESPRANVRIISMDMSAALDIDGIADVFTAADVPGENWLAIDSLNAELIAVSESRYVGQPLMVLAGTSLAALRAAMDVVELELSPQAEGAASNEVMGVEAFTGQTQRVVRGDPTARLGRADHVLEGTFRSGSADLFDVEPLAALAFPGENGQIIIYATTPSPRLIQSATARCLGVPEEQVVCLPATTRARSTSPESHGVRAALLAALIAAKLKKPARFVDPSHLDRHVPRNRHAHYARYQVGFASNGRMDALAIDHYSESGCISELNTEVVLDALQIANNAYFVPDFAVTWTVYGPGLAPNEATCNVGAPQAVATIENIIEEIAFRLKLDPLEVRRRNCYGGPGRDIAHFGQTIPNNPLPVIIDRLAESAGYERRRAEIVRFNGSSRNICRGLALTPVKYESKLTARRENDGTAQVNVDQDGTIRVAVGRPDMGPTLNTIFRQQVADQFGMPAQAVRIATKSGEDVRPSPWSARPRVDLDGAAAIRACEILRRRLANLAVECFAELFDSPRTSVDDVRFDRATVFDMYRPNRCVSFVNLVRRGHAENANLGAQGFYAATAVDLNPHESAGNRVVGFMNGAAVSEVEIDRVTGKLTTERVDILIQIGRSANPANDRGQVFARFIEGMRWATSEERTPSQTGEPFWDSTNIGTMATFDGLPRSVKVDFLESAGRRDNAEDDRSLAALSFLLGVSVWASARQALAGLADERLPDLKLPVTTEEIRHFLVEVGRDGSSAHAESANSH